MDDIQAIFFEECAEGLAAAEAGLSAMVEGDTSDATIAAVFRAVHSIKGGSGAFGHGALMAFSHRFENVLDEVRAGRMAPTRPLVQQLLRAFDILSDHVLAARGEAPVPADATMLAELDGLLAGEAVTVSPVATPPVDEDPFGFEPVLVDLHEVDDAFANSDDWVVHFRPSRAAMANGAEPLLIVRELERLGGRVVAVDSADLPSLADLDVEDSYLGWRLILPGALAEDELRDCFDFLPPDSLVELIRTGAGDAIVADVLRPSSMPVAAPPASNSPTAGAPAPEKAAARAEAMSVRVDLARLDHLLNLVGELVIRNSVLADRLSPAHQEKVELPQLLRLTRQIQDGVMGLRAQPIAQAFNRVPRMLRDLEAETGKSIRLEVSGEQTEVDKRVIERIGDPLTHMIRNAADHGIESIEQRRAASKDPQGTIRLSAEQKGGRIIVRVADDGSGIDRARVLAKAIDKGIVPAGAELSDEEIDQLICAPGFSTAETISNISGRGVGMDVVRSNIEQLGGRVEISSVPGQGTSFTMILPLTLAILDGMVVRLGGHRYVLPLGSVIESVQPEPGQLQELSPGAEVLELRGSFLPVRRLTRFFNLREDERALDERLVIVVESDSAGAVGLMVDTIEDRREVVIKSLDQNLYPVRGLGGATVLGDGSIALILDIDAIGRRLGRHDANPERTGSMSDTSERKIVTFSLGEKIFGIDMSVLIEIREWEAPTPLPGVPGFIRGVANLRGTVIPIVDLSERLGWSATRVHGRSCILVVVLGGKQAGFLVDEVNDIVSIDPAQIQPAPEIEIAEPGVIAGLIHLVTRGSGEQGTMVSLLDLDVLGVTRQLELAA